MLLVGGSRRPHILHWPLSSAESAPMPETRWIASQKEPMMNRDRFAKQLAAVAGIPLLFAASGLALTQSASPAPARPPISASSSAQPQRGTPENDFAGLTFTDDQQKEIDRIRQEFASHRDLVKNDEKLTADQKDAMLAGYTRLENNSIFNVLTPEQQKQVREKVHARHAAEQAARKKPLPPR